MKNIFSQEDTIDFIKRINSLTASTQPKWGKMSVDQMLAHCNVAFEMIYEPEKHKKPSTIAKWILRTFVKSKLTDNKPYKQNLPTSPAFIIVSRNNFDLEKKRLIGYIQKTQQLGEKAFDGKENLNLGKLSSKEWNNMLSKHINHHLNQFGV